MAKDGGKHKSSSVKPSEDGEGESEAVLQKRKEVREGMYRDRLERLKESEKQQYLQKQEAMSMKPLPGIWDSLPVTSFATVKCRAPKLQPQQAHFHEVFDMHN